MSHAVKTLQCLFLVLALLIGAGVGGYLRTAHAMTREGMQTLVICGTHGAEEVTLDRDGNPVDPGMQWCDHCADCSLIPLFDVPPEQAGPARADVWARAGQIIGSDLVRQALRLAPPSRGPPVQVRKK